jgi:hypothetical protein
MLERYSLNYNKEDRNVIRFANYNILKHHGFSVQQARAYRDYRPSCIAKLLKNQCEIKCEK